MRFGNGREGLNGNSVSRKTICVLCPDLGRKNAATFIKERSRPAYSQECLPKAQANGLLSGQGDIKRI